MGAQVEAATGGQDVIRFCGGLRAVLAAVGIPLNKAQSSSLHQAQPSSLQSTCSENPPATQANPLENCHAAHAVANASGRLHLSRRSASEQGQQPELTHDSLPSAGAGAAVLEGALQNLAGSAKDQVSFGTIVLAASAQHLPSVCPASAQRLSSICTAAAQLLHSIYTPYAWLLDSFCKQAAATNIYSCAIFNAWHRSLLIAGLSGRVYDLL